MYQKKQKFSIWEPDLTHRFMKKKLNFQEKKIEKLPVVDKDFKLQGLITYKDITKASDRPNSCKDKQGRLRVAAAVGIEGVGNIVEGVLDFGEGGCLISLMGSCWWSGW